MSLSSGSGTPGASKRPAEDVSTPGNENKKVKAEVLENPLDDAHLNGLFDPLPFETKGGAIDSGFDSSNAKFEMPDFLADRLDVSTPPVNNGSALAATSKSPAATSVGAGTPTDSKFSGAITNNADNSASGFQKTNAQTSYNNANLTNVLSLPRVNSTSRVPDYHQGQASNSPATAPQLYQSSSSINVSSAYPYQKTTAGSMYPNQYRANAGTPGPQYKPSTRFDPKKTYPAPTGVPNMTNAGPAMTGYGGGNAGSTQDKDKPADPSKLNDALAAAGVDIQREEELLSIQNNRTAINLHQQQFANRQRQTFGPMGSFLHPYHVALFMNRTARENGVAQNFMVDPEMLDFMSAACKEWLSSIVMKTIALARHRRRGIPAFNNKNGNSGGKPKSIPPLQRSEVSKELRNLALRQKEQEERRVAKRLALGLEKSDDVAPETGNKVGAEETLHRAANATAAMMTMNPSRKKYSWMTSGASDGGDAGKASPAKDSSSKQSSLISTRGDNGLRYREIRTGNMVTTKDLLGVLEDERMGTSKALIKGYAKLKD